MLTIQDVSNLALYIYHDNSVNKKYLSGYVVNQKLYDIKTLQEAIKTQDGMFEVAADRPMQNMINFQQNFYGSVFVKVKHQQPQAMVISIRGTEPEKWNNDWADIHSWWKCIFDENAKVNCPQYYCSNAHLLCCKAMDFAKSLALSYQKIFVTGHSLGGAIAALVPTKIQLPLRAITFNAPGIKQIPGVKNISDRVINIRSEYDFVSSVGEPVGPQWNVFVPEHAQQAKSVFEINKPEEKYPLPHRLLNNMPIQNLLAMKDFLLSVRAQHSMLNLWKTLNHQTVDKLTYASFELLIQFLRKQYDSSCFM